MLRVLVLPFPIQIPSPSAISRSSRFTRFDLTSRFTRSILLFPSNDTFFVFHRTIHSSFSSIRYILRSKEKVGEGLRTLNPWHRMNLLTNKPTRPRCPALWQSYTIDIVDKIEVTKTENKSFLSFLATDNLEIGKNRGEHSGRHIVIVCCANTVIYIKFKGQIPHHLGKLTPNFLF